MSFSTTPRGGALTARGGWNTFTQYFQDDFVIYNGIEYQSLLPYNKGNQPDVSAFAWAAVTGTTAPSGPAGGDLTGTYPNPTIVAPTWQNGGAAVGNINTTITGVTSSWSAPVAGIYCVTGIFDFNATVTGWGNVNGQLWKNGSQIIINQVAWLADVGVAIQRATVAAQWITSLAASDSLQLIAQKANAGGTIASGSGTTLSAFRIR